MDYWGDYVELGNDSVMIFVADRATPFPPWIIFVTGVGDDGNKEAQVQPLESLTSPAFLPPSD